MVNLSNNCWKLYFIQLSPKDGGQIVYKLGITERANVLDRFDEYINDFNIKVLCSLVFSSVLKAKSFEEALLSIYNNSPSKQELDKYNVLSGQGEIRSLSGKEKMELLNFMFMLKKNTKFCVL